MSAVIELHHNGKFSMLTDLATMRRYQDRIKKIDGFFHSAEAWNNTAEIKDKARQEAVKLRDELLDELEKHGMHFSYNIVPSEFNEGLMNHFFTIYCMATLIGNSFYVWTNWFD